ncbi:MAG: AbrB family transcriptional regulator [Candidatus Accumulibacter sp.]|jgi:membrane AbrB-like protein|nr:AbrB family transcriptional regulator [Accumulibacter sp.]
MPDPARRFPSLSGWPRFVHWVVLLILSLAFAGLFDIVRLPAALLLGAMLAAILVAVADGLPRVTRKVFVAAQSIIGCLIARGITPEIVVSLREDWLIFVSVTLLVVFACAAMGWVLARRQVLPGTTALWAVSPGGASIMALMSDAYGGDMRLVAVMQYLRVVITTILATLAAHWWIGGAPAEHGVFFGWFAQVSWDDLTKTLALAGACALIGLRFRVPGGPVMLPMVLGSVLQANDLMTIVLPQWILAPTYAIVGWGIGLRFSRQTLAQVAHALPSMLASIACLIAICVGIAAGLTCLTEIDPLTAYLATSPGGADSVAIIAASSNVNVSFVMAFQTARLLIVTAAGPALARYLTGRLGIQKEGD